MVVCGGLSCVLGLVHAQDKASRRVGKEISCWLRNLFWDPRGDSDSDSDSAYFCDEAKGWSAWRFKRVRAGRLRISGKLANEACQEMRLTYCAFQFSSLARAGEEVVPIPRIRT